MVLLVRQSDMQLLRYLLDILYMIYNSADFQVSKVLHEALHFFIITTGYVIIT